jgi:hypothetical protein
MGPEGPVGPLEIYVTSSDILDVPPHFVLNDLTAECPNGMHVVSGGFQSVNKDIVITRTAPNRNFGGWQISAYNNSDVPVPIQAYAICVPSELIPVEGLTHTGNLEAIKCEYPSYPCPSSHCSNSAGATGYVPVQTISAPAQKRYAPPPRKSCR